MPKGELGISLPATLEQSVHQRKVSREEAKSLLCEFWFNSSYGKLNFVHLGFEQVMAGRGAGHTR